MRWPILLLSLATVSFANELSRCCGGGHRHYTQTETCSNIKSIGTSMLCTRAASICCLRALIDASCDAGAELARVEETCPSHINVLGGGLKKECCDCCLLANELVRRNEPCVPPTGFSAACLRSFNRCCQAKQLGVKGVVPVGSGKKDVYPHSEEEVHFGDRCAESRCEHLCNDRGGDDVECSCRAGYDLGPDGYTCTDIDECSLLVDDCLESQRCLNIPGSFKCIRTLSCGTGYVMDSQTEQCVDTDECNLGSHDCGALYQCRNTQGSYRCDPKKCGDGEIQNPLTGECTSFECPLGYMPKNGKCIDVDECKLVPPRCSPLDECINTPGSFRCQTRGNLCAEGFRASPMTGFCEDIDECMDRNMCGHLACINLPGTYKCKCLPGYEFDEQLKQCVDVDECVKFAGHVCDTQAQCVNTLGSFECRCNKGFQLAVDGRKCEDIDECTAGTATCAQKCVNIPGGYQCICDRGYALALDGTTCEDIDECALWAGTGNDLCMGGCINTPGSYTCQCPIGYKIMPDGKTCADIDECLAGECSGADRVCVNTLGHFKCHRIECPENYVHDKNYKKCTRTKSACGKLSESSCKNKHPLHVTWQFLSIPRHVPITAQRPSITLFTIKGPAHKDVTAQFELMLKKSIPEAAHVLPAVRSNFLLQKGGDRNSAVIAVRDSLDGPQMIELELVLRTTKNGVFTGKYLANLILHVAAHKRHRDALSRL